MLGVDGMNFISASYNMYHNSIDITTFDGYILRIVVLCQDLVQVKMRNFSHFNLPKAQP